MCLKYIQKCTDNKSYLDWKHLMNNLYTETNYKKGR